MSVTLAKGQRISLAKDGQTLSRISMGLGWDVARRKGLFGMFGGKSEDIDLDASCLVFDTSDALIDQIWFRQLSGMSGTIVHTGDNLTGDGEGDDETIKVDLSRLPASTKALVFTVNSFRGQTFEKVENATCRVLDDQAGSELARFNLSESGSHTGMVMAKIYRHGAEWKIHAIGEKTHGRTFQDMMIQIRAAL
jgi:tellurium resistance protein TerZ